MCVCTCKYVCAFACYGIVCRKEVKEQLVRINSLRPSCGPQGSHSGSQAIYLYCWATSPTLITLLRASQHSVDVPPSILFLKELSLPPWLLSPASHTSSPLPVHLPPSGLSFLLFVCKFSFELRCHLSQATVELTVWPRLTSKLWHSYSHFSNAEVAGTHHCSQFACVFKAPVPLLSPHPHSGLNGLIHPRHFSTGNVLEYPFSVYWSEWDVSS